MNEAHVTVVGNAVTPVDFRTSSGGVPLARFRLASTARRFDRQRGSWTDGATSFYTVWVWRTLAKNVASSVAVGEPIIVQGQLRIQEGERSGRRFLSADLTATAVGHDLTRGTSAFVRVASAGPGPTGPTVPALPETEAVPGGPEAVAGPEAADRLPAPEGG